MVLIVSPVGTSLIQNFVRCQEFRAVVEKYTDRGVEEWHRLPVDDDRNRYPDGYICSVVRGHELYEAMKLFVEKYGVKSCAEVNGIEAIVKLYSLTYSDTDVLLLPTQVCNSMLCASILKEVLSERFRSVEVVPFRSIRSIDEFEVFAIEVLDKVVKRIIDAKKRGIRVFVNATPGFKPESSFLTLASILSNADAVVYIHEAFREGVVLPIPPIRMDIDVVEIIKKIFGSRDCIDYGSLLQIVDERTLISLIDRGVLYRRYGDVCVRRWVRKLIEVYQV